MTRHPPPSQEAPAYISQCLLCLLKVPNPAGPATCYLELAPPAKQLESDAAYSVAEYIQTNAT
jgi:hypothetical protein